MNLETIDSLHYLKMCFYESLRIEPPVPISSSICLTEDQTIGKFKIKKGQAMFASIHTIHHSEQQWKQPDTFIPERFDQLSKWYLTPSGGQRHIQSFIPFLGGKRVCLGKTFAEVVFKITLPLILNSLDFEFGDEQQRLAKPFNNAVQNKRPQIQMKVKAKPTERQ